MSNRQENSFNWWSFFLGILYIIVGIVSFNYPGESILAIVYVYAILAIIRGIMLIIIRNRIADTFFFTPNGLIVFDIIDILIGVLLLFNVEIGIITMPILFAICFIIDAIMLIANVGPIRHISTGKYWLLIILGVIGVIIGFYLLFNPIATLAMFPIMVGIYFIAMGVATIIAVF